MSIEKRMQEFEKVSQKPESVEDVTKRMEEFEKVPGAVKQGTHEKTGTLPFGLKRFRPCPHCSEFMEIYEVKKDGADYFCKNCSKVVNVKANE